jgi:serine/threonine-protein kinase HipA
MVNMVNKTLYIHMNGLHVGMLEKTREGGLFFRYDQSWLNTQGSRPISLSLPLIDKPFSGDIVYNFFDNLLPDNVDIRKRIQTKFKALSSHPFDLLAKIGKDCVGAIKLTDDNDHAFTESIKYEVITSQKIAKILRSYKTNPLGMSNEFENFRISIAGAQEKSAFLYHQNKWNIPLEDTPTTHIFKLPICIIPHQQIDLSDSCENEWLCSKIAKAFGFAVAECEIEYFEDLKVLVVERFDRRLSSDKSWIMRLPQEDMCQAFGVSPNLKYQSDGGPGIIAIMKLLLGSDNPFLYRDIFFKIQILFWLLCAIDGHAKNFSIFIHPESKYSLTPLYDIMSAFPLSATKQLSERKVKMAMALRGKNNHYKWWEASRSYFIDTAKNSGYSPHIAEQILDEMLSKVDNVIYEVSNTLPDGFPSHIALPIFEGMIFMKNRLSVK